MSDEPVCPRSSNSEGSPEFKGLVLDFGGVLTTSFDEALRSYCIRDGLPPDALEWMFTLDAGAHGALVDLECGKLGQAEFVALLARTLDVEADGLLERMTADLRREPLVATAAARLRQHGVRVAVLSNSWGSSPFDPYAPFRLHDTFDAVIISDQVGLRKPDPAIFRLTAGRLGLEPAQCVFVDDVARYLEPARALGMATIHATDPDETVEQLAEIFEVSCR